MTSQTEETIISHIQNWGQPNLEKLIRLTNEQEVSLENGWLSTLKDAGYIEWGSTDNIIKDTFEFIYASGLVVAFDWPHWMERKQVLADIRAGKDIATLDLVKSLTSIVRADRFSEGTFSRATIDGTIYAILKKLSENLIADR